MEEEIIWKDVISYEGQFVGKYMVNNKGDVLSLNYNNTKKSKLLSPRLNKDGYPIVCLSIGGLKVTAYVHIIEWEAFNGMRPEGLQINHINEDKTDNRLENLNLMTLKENINWGTRTFRAITKKTGLDHMMSEEELRNSRMKQRIRDREKHNLYNREYYKRKKAEKLLSAS